MTRPTQKCPRCGLTFRTKAKTKSRTLYECTVEDACCKWRRVRECTYEKDCTAKKVRKV
jgi:hypothetical protein